MKFDTIIIGGGLAGCTMGKVLVDEGLNVLIISEGLSLHECPKVNCTWLRGDSAVDPVYEAGILKAIHTTNLGSTALEADVFVLATGKFFSRGLISTMETIYEPVFGADVRFDPDRTKWYNPDFTAPQPFESYGVMTDEEGHVLINQSPILNLYACGEVKQGKPEDIAIDATKLANRILCRKKTSAPAI